MSSITIHSSVILKKMLFDLPHGQPVSKGQMKGFGISHQLAHYYVQKGWLRHLGCGYYLRAGDKLTETGVVASLQANGVKIHIGGKSALARNGFIHYLSMGGETLTLYGQGIRGLPEWFRSQFKVILSNSVLFDEHGSLDESFCVSRMNQDADAPFVSEPERAVLEMLDFVPKKQTIEEARQIMEALHSLRSAKMEVLLKRCKKIKVKRLFWGVAEALGLPVLKNIDLSEVDFGSKSVYVLHDGENLVLRNPNG